jgi:hypothetical protein
MLKYEPRSHAQEEQLTRYRNSQNEKWIGNKILGRMKGKYNTCACWRRKCVMLPLIQVRNERAWAIDERVKGKNWFPWQNILERSWVSWHESMLNWESFPDVEGRARSDAQDNLGDVDTCTISALLPTRPFWAFVSTQPVPKKNAQLQAVNVTRSRD